MQVEIFEFKEYKYKKQPIRLKLQMNVGYPTLICVNEDGTHVATLLCFDIEKGGMRSAPCVKRILEDSNYDISGLDFNEDGSIRFRLENEGMVLASSNICGVKWNSPTSTSD